MRRKRLRKFRLQSAMEYLMTYGWAILIIAVVLGVLFQMGVFNSSSVTVRVPPGACKVLRTSAAVNLVGQCSGILPKYVAQFDGKSSYVSVANSKTLGYATPPTISYSTWIYLNSTASGAFNTILSRTNDGFSLQITDTGTCYGEVYINSGTEFPVTTATAIPARTWTLLTITFDGNSLDVYINGVLNNFHSGAGATTFYSYLNPWNIGMRSGNRFFNGFISNVQIYNNSLDSSSVATLYQEGIGGAPVDPNHIVGWWPLNGDTNDYSGNNNNGAPTGVTYISQYGK